MAMSMLSRHKSPPVQTRGPPSALPTPPASCPFQPGEMPEGFPTISASDYTTTSRISYLSTHTSDSFIPCIIRSSTHTNAHAHTHTLDKVPLFAGLLPNVGHWLQCLWISFGPSPLKCIARTRSCAEDGVPGHPRVTQGSKRSKVRSRRRDATHRHRNLRDLGRQNHTTHASRQTAADGGRHLASGRSFTEVELDGGPRLSGEPTNRPAYRAGPTCVLGLDRCSYGPVGAG
ncbi:hypothetical protein B0T19DRAFT_192836 [Cercophora scortea]|uniref:Uncharacterized protein n=1 Tax=Cercophora scortea TaxID=314031 RepID=A0AAE0INX3_9PEZI|nr:hypothetical protein B0T19DRAFT_192836 [Cercophora scortea]